MKHIKNMNEALKIKDVKIIDLQEFDKLVVETYGKPYSLQQQDGCKERGIEYFSVPTEWSEDNEMNDSIPEIVNGDEMGVKFDVWLNRDPKYTETGLNDWELNLFWDRNFYPDFNTLVNNLHEKGLIPEGKYGIDIDW